MRFFIPGFIIGAVINLFVLMPHTGMAFYPEFTGTIKDISFISPSPFISGSGHRSFSVKTADSINVLAENGMLEKTMALEGLTAVSGNGKYIIRYGKVGPLIELVNISGESFWKRKNLEYPHLSYSGHLIFMLNGDQTHITVMDYNGNIIGNTHIDGRLATVIGFADRGDCGYAGFLDGSFDVIGSTGQKLLSGMTEGQGAVKSMGISNSGKYAAVHFGNTESDRLSVYDTSDGSHSTCNLPSVFKTKTAVNVSDSGDVAFLSRKSFICINKSGRSEFSLPIEEKRDGQCSIKMCGDFYAAGYTTRNGMAKFMLVSKEGQVISARYFPGESFLDISVDGNVILVRGSDNLYCYSLRSRAD